MTKKNTIRMEKDGNALRVGNKWYHFALNNDGDFATGQFTLIEMDKKKYDRNADYITKRLFSFVDPKLVMRDALKDMTDVQLEKLAAFLRKRKGKIVKPKIRKHCIQMRIGGVEIPIR